MANGGEELSAEQLDKLLQFQDLTGIEDFERCKVILANHQWNLESAVEDQFTDSQSPSLTTHYSLVNRLPRIRRERPPLVNVNPPDQRVVTATPRYNAVTGSWFQWSYALITLPLRFVYSSLYSLFCYIYRLLRPDIRIIPQNPELDVQQFIEQFESTFGRVHPNFFRGTYNMALNEAKRDLKFLLVYLHCIDHQDVPSFCRQTLCSQLFTEYVNENMLFWACSTNLAEGYRVSQALRDTTYPFMALIVLKNNRMTVVARIEGFHEGPELIVQLNDLINANKPGLLSAQRDREERDFNLTLRQQQDEAYNMSLLADREKERRKREKEEELERMKREKDEQLRAQREREMQQQQLITSLKDRLRSRLPQEPDALSPNTIRVLLKLPNGTRLERRFDKHESVQHLHDFLFVHESAPDDFEIIKSHPRIPIPCRKRIDMATVTAEVSNGDVQDLLDYDGDDGQEDDVGNGGGSHVPTFDELGFGKSELLYVHDNDA